MIGMFTTVFRERSLGSFSNHDYQENSELGSKTVSYVQVLERTIRISQIYGRNMEIFGCLRVGWFCPKRETQID